MKTINLNLIIGILFLMFCYPSFGQTHFISTQSPVPTANAGIDNTIALGGSTSIGSVAVGGLTYGWTSLPAGYTSTAAQSTVNPTVPTTYYLQVSNGSGCIDMDTVFVNVTGTALATQSKVANPATICSGTSSILSIVAQGGTGTYTYNWNLVGNATVLGTNDSLTVTPTNATASAIVVRYHVAFTDGVQPAVNDTINVTVNPVPTANGGIDKTIALGGSTSIGSVAVGGLTYGWTSLPAGYTSTAAQPTVNPTVPTTYYLQVSNGSCIDMDTVFVNVTGTALATQSKVANPATICSGTSSILSIVAQGGTGTYTYNWNLVGNATVLGTNDSLTVTPTNATASAIVVRYHVAFTDGVQPAVNDTINVTVNPLPLDQTFTTANISYCPGNVPNLHLNSSQSGFTYQLQNYGTTTNVGSAIIGTGAPIDIPWPAGDYQILMTNPATTCSKKL